jgi:hypothetical protein
MPAKSSQAGEKRVTAIEGGLDSADVLVNAAKRDEPDELTVAVWHDAMTQNTSPATHNLQPSPWNVTDDVTFVPIWQTLRIAVVDKSVQNTGWFIYGGGDNNQFGTGLG